MKMPAARYNLRFEWSTCFQPRVRLPDNLRRQIERERDKVDRNTMPADVKAADDQLAATLTKVDEFATMKGLDDEVGPKQAVPATRLQPAPTELDLRAENITTVLWATGFRRRYPWLQVPVLDSSGEIRHDGGVTPSPGLYVIGHNFLRRRKSTFIDGVGDDARDLSAHIAERQPLAAA